MLFYSIVEENGNEVKMAAAFSLKNFSDLRGC